MIYNFGSINIDHVYRVPHIPVGGETLASVSFESGLGVWTQNTTDDFNWSTNSDSFL